MSTYDVSGLQCYEHTEAAPGGEDLELELTDESSIGCVLYNMMGDSHDIYDSES